MALLPTGCAGLSSMQRHGAQPRLAVPKWFRKAPAPIASATPEQLPSIAAANPSRAPSIAATPSTNGRSTAPPPGSSDPRSSLATAPALPRRAEPTLEIPAPPAMPADGPILADAPPIPAPRTIAPLATTPALTPQALILKAKQALNAMASYQVRLYRQERVGHALLDPEEVELSIRREPKAVRLHWPDGPSKGREVLFAAGGAQDLMHIYTPGALVQRISLPVASPLVSRNSRHPITEAGLDTIVDQMERDAASPSNPTVYAGLETPQGFVDPHHKLTLRDDKGQQNTIYLDPATHLPVIVNIRAANGDLLEDYRFTNLRPDPTELASNDAFDPDRRWGAPKGLLSRLGSGGRSAAAEEQVTR